MKLIVGLGNPGKEFDNTRHNVGFMVLDSFFNDYNLDFKKKFNGLYATFKHNDENILLLKPLSYMNLSGGVVKKFASYYNIDIKDILIIYDDVDFDLGSYRVKKQGSSGGHNGIKDIIAAFKTEEINRIRVGIGKGKSSMENYVLSAFSMSELKIFDGLIPLLKDMIKMFIETDIETVMQEHNHR